MTKNFVNKIKPKAKYLLTVLALAAVVSQGALAINRLLADSPRFNIKNGDYELFRGLNQTSGENVWKDPVEGNAGDIFKGIIYYHNGVDSSVAENTRIKVTIPPSTSGNTAFLSARISADNAEATTDTIVDGQIIGQSGLTVNLNSGANLELVPGSVRWYPDQQNNPDTPAALPFGQTGDEIISENGLNLGNIQGCWQYAGFVVFSFRTVANTAPALSVQKMVRNINAGGSYLDEVNASAKDKVEFKIVVANSGNQNIPAVVFRDALPSGLTYVANSMKLYRAGSSTPEELSEAVVAEIFADGWNMGGLESGENKANTFIFSAAAPRRVNQSKQLINYAYATAGELSSSDQAVVNLVPTPSENIVLHKTARNLNSGQNAEIRTIAGRQVLALDALPGDRIEYTLTTSNTGNASAEDYLIEDGIADILEYAQVTAISDGGSVVNGTSGNEAKLLRYPSVTIAPGETLNRTFVVQIFDPLPNNPPSGYSYDMQMYNAYGDEVIVVLSRPTPPQPRPFLKVEKLVRDFTTNQLEFVDHNQAIAGDTLEYLIRLSNVGSGPADQIRIKDVLPINTEYISGTTIISVDNQMEHTLSDGITADGVVLDTLPAGSSGYIKIKVVTSSSIPADETLTNTVVLTDDEVTLSDTAKTTFQTPAVLTPAPVLPKTGSDALVISWLSTLVVASLVYKLVKLS